MPSSTFRTLERQEEAISPSNGGPHNPRLAALSAPHVESFNTIFELGGGPGILERAIQDIGKVTVFDSNESSPNKLESGFSNTSLDVGTLISHIKLSTVWLSGVSIGKPTIESNRGGMHVHLLPSECRERGISYRSKMQAKLNWRVNGGPVQMEVRSFGQLPVMVRVCLFFLCRFDFFFDLLKLNVMSHHRATNVICMGNLPRTSLPTMRIRMNLVATFSAMVSSGSFGS